VFVPSTAEEGTGTVEVEASVTLDPENNNLEISVTDVDTSVLEEAITDAQEAAAAANEAAESANEAIAHFKGGTTGQVLAKKSDADYDFEWQDPEGGTSFDIHELQQENDLADADEVPFYDASAQGNRKTVWSNIKAKLKAYFDSIYATAVALANKVDKVAGKDLSENDYTDADKAKLDSLHNYDDSAVVADIAALDGRADDIEEKIPASASAQNQLTDKNFVNSSISTATATFKGTYNLVSDLLLTTSATTAQIAAALAFAITGEDNNDYAFVQIPTADATPTEISRVDRYKFDGTDWAYEFSLNNSSFTAAQWAAINSGITATLVTAFGAKYDKPSTGIPKSDLAEGVQASLGKADTALQSFTETDPTVPAWAKVPTKPTYNYSEIQNTPTIPEFTDYTDAELQTAIDTAFAGL